MCLHHQKSVELFPIFLSHLIFCLFLSFFFWFTVESQGLTACWFRPVDNDLLSYKIHKSPWLSDRKRDREKIKCELLLWLFPLMSTLFLFLLSNPTLGSGEPQVSILSPSPYKTRPHRWPPLADLPKPCSHWAARAHSHIIGLYFGQVYHGGNCKSLFYWDKQKDGKNNSGMRRENYHQAEGGGVKWVNWVDRVIGDPRLHALICDGTIWTIPLGNI